MQPHAAVRVVHCQGQDGGQGGSPAVETDRSGEEGHRERESDERSDHDHLEGAREGQEPEREPVHSHHRPREGGPDEEELLVPEDEARLPAVDSGMGDEVTLGEAGADQVGHDVFAVGGPRPPRAGGQPDAQPDGEGQGPENDQILGPPPERTLLGRPLQRKRFRCRWLTFLCAQAHGREVYGGLPADLL